MKRYFILFVGLVLMSGSCNTDRYYSSANELVQEALKIVKVISVKELNELMQSDEIYTLIDVRQKSEHYHGYIPGAL